VHHDCDLVAGFDGGALPSQPHQVLRSIHFDGPDLVRSIRGFDADLERGMRIDPIELGDGADQGLLFDGVEHGPGMMRQYGGTSGSQQQGGASLGNAVHVTSSNQITVRER
jgi:hypothetical protein